MRPSVTALFCFALVAACDKSNSPAETPEPPPAADPEVREPPDEPKPAEKPAPPDPATPEGLAKILLADGGVAWLAATNRAITIESWNQEGTGIGMKAVLVDHKDKREEIALCEPTDCDQQKSKLGDKLIEELRKRSVTGAVMMKATDWAADAKELDLEDETKLAWKRNHLEVARKGKPAKALPNVKVSPPHKAAPDAVYVAPDGSVVAVRVSFDPGEKYGQGFNVFSELHVYRMP